VPCILLGLWSWTKALAILISIGCLFRYDTSLSESLSSHNAVLPLRLFPTMDCLEQCRGKQDTEDDERMHRPFYTSRHPPLVQPLHISLFSERTRKKYGAPDLAHEWIALFQMISGSPLERSISATRGLRSSMKMNVPDTVFLSPTG
jgi:hypothetical protein